MTFHDTAQMLDYLQSKQPDKPITMPCGAVIRDYWLYTQTIASKLKNSSKIMQDKGREQLTNLYIQMRGDNVEKYIIYQAYEYYKGLKKLKLKHEECYDFMLMYGVFQDESHPAWKAFYEKLKPLAVKAAHNHLKAEMAPVEAFKSIEDGTSPLVDRYLKLKALEVYFERKSPQELYDTLKDL